MNMYEITQRKVTVDTDDDGDRIVTVSDSKGSVTVEAQAFLEFALYVEAIVQGRLTNE